MHASLIQVRSIIDRLELFESILTEQDVSFTSEVEVIKNAALGTEIRYEFQHRDRFLAWEIEVDFDRVYPGLAHALLYIAVKHRTSDGRQLMFVNVSFDSTTDHWRIRYGNEHEIPGIRMIRSNFPEREDVSDADIAPVLTFLVRHVMSVSDRPRMVSQLV